MLAAELGMNKEAVLLASSPIFNTAVADQVNTGIKCNGDPMAIAIVQLLQDAEGLH